MMKNIFSNKYIKYTLLLLSGLFLGWLLFHDSGKVPSDGTVSVADEHDEEEYSTWTCSMHPQIRMDKPGDCPICGMDLIPLNKSGSMEIDADAVHLSREAAQLANVMTSFVSSQYPVKEIRLYGKVQVDERMLQSQVAHVPGRIEMLNVNFTGENVKQGQLLAEIYSPELITAQRELLQTAGTRQLQPELYEAARERLKQWKLTESQVDEIEKSGKIVNNVRVYSNTSGTVVARYVNTGDYVSGGTVLFSIADLSRVWVLFDAYESDLPFLDQGKKISFTLQALPGKEYSGNISFIDPVIDPAARVARVRVEVPNRSGELKPEMFVTGIVSASLPASGSSLVIPRSAVLWTGRRSIVYVKQPGDEMIFKMREIELGPSLGESYVVNGGLEEGEEIVTNGTFSVDASAQLEGKPSMMNPGGGQASTGHDHGSLQPGASQESPELPAEKISVSMDFTMQLNKVYESYLGLKNALVESDHSAAKKAAAAVNAALSGVDMKLLGGDPGKRWMDISAGIGKAASSMVSAGDIEAQRTRFSQMSDNMYRAVKTFGLMDKTVYRQFCPMAFNDKGAYWLSELEEIRNPYFGDEMLTCGETREVLR